VDPLSERAAAAIIRAWIEPGTEGALKIRITTNGDIESRRQTVGVASSIDEACSIVRAWLEAFVRQANNAAERGRAS
jgi:hypothetical protein